jgi:hypothetical protein
MATIEQIISRYPVLYHMAELDSWPSIQQHGLLSVTALLNTFDYGGAEREAIESRWRPESVTIEHEVHGTAVIRDQGPMPPQAVRRVLNGMTPCEWYRLINGKAFLWATNQRLLTFLDAEAYRDTLHIVLTVDTRQLLARHAGRVSLAHFNTGSVSRWGTPTRGQNTFRRVPDYPVNKVVAEVAVDCRIPDISDFTLAVDEWRGRQYQRELWRP